MIEKRRIGSGELEIAPLALGFAQVRQRGSYVVMRRGAIGCVVPSHKELKTGTLAGIIRQAQLTQHELLVFDTVG